MKRARLVALLGAGAAAWPLTIRAPQEEMPVVGFLHSASASYVRSVAGFEKPLADAIQQGAGALIEPSNSAARRCPEC